LKKKHTFEERRYFFFGWKGKIYIASTPGNVAHPSEDDFNITNYKVADLLLTEKSLETIFRKKKEKIVSSNKSAKD
jgi:hypothetical protein